MADKKTSPAKTDKAVATPSSKKGGKVGIVTSMLILGAAFPFILPTMVLFLVGMIPTFVALMTDKEREPSGVTAVGAMNAAGIVPFVIDLWTKDQTMAMTFQILHDPTTWLVMFGTAAVGHLLLIAVPPVMTSMSLIGMESRLKILKANLDHLKTNWGADVATTKPLNKLTQIE